ncbi:hypothetical protein [Thermomonospora catenispora]|uniref:hypothetical protein n=1 Tax=Thermomonospora catenispora TaxID=2493090 RepID=UPI001123ECBA|nr:hypothetical protein [Thermomonospora catenispora]TNY36046.1 hypothetical protein EIO00_15295 [Thermomonospora catenispora]
MQTENSVPMDDHAAEVEALSRRYPGWSIWFGLSTRRWWALPPRSQDIGDFIEAETPQRLIARIEAHPVPSPAAPRPAPPRPAPPQPAPHGREPARFSHLPDPNPPTAHHAGAAAWPGRPGR